MFLFWNWLCIFWTFFYLITRYSCYVTRNSRSVTLATRETFAWAYFLRFCFQISAGLLTWLSKQFMKNWYLLYFLNYSVFRAENSTYSTFHTFSHHAIFLLTLPAFQAYRQWVERNGEEKLLPGIKLNHDQLFFLNYARIWCGTMRPEDALSKIRSSVHSLGPIRVLGPLSNSEDFARAYHCPVGSRMNPKKKCSVWWRRPWGGHCHASSVFFNAHTKMAYSFSTPRKEQRWGGGGLRTRLPPEGREGRGAWEVGEAGWRIISLAPRGLGR